MINSGKYKSWSQVAPDVNRELYGDDRDNWRDESAFRKAVQYARKFYEAGVFDSNVDQYIDNIRKERRGLEKERKKIQTEKLEYNKWLREEARDEMIFEQIETAVTSLPPLEIPVELPSVSSPKSWLAVWADAHYGVEFDLKDMFGNSVNAYSPEIFEERMRLFLSKLIDIIEKEQITELNIWELGDGINGILRLTSQLMKLRYGIIESAILYADYVANWLNVLSNSVRINYQMVVDSNHNQLRLLGAPKNAFPEENMSKVMLALIKTRLKDNPNITFIENPTGYCYKIMSGWSVFGYHGERGNIGKALEGFSRTYSTPIDYAISGHSHHSSSEEVAARKEAISVRSFIGVDSYALSLNRTSDPGASVFGFDNADGLVQEYKIKF